jgi:hypothetical protein
MLRRQLKVYRMWSPQKTGLEVHVRPTRLHRLGVKTPKITWKRSKGQCGLRNRLGLILNLPTKKRNQSHRGHEIDGIIFLSSRDVCFVTACSERGALQGGSKLLDSPKETSAELNFCPLHQRSIYKTQSAETRGFMCLSSVCLVSSF